MKKTFNNLLTMTAKETFLSVFKIVMIKFFPMNSYAKRNLSILRHKSF